MISISHHAGAECNDGEVTFSGNDLKHMLGGASIGLTKRFGISLDASLAPHYQTKEIKYSIGSRDIRWSGLAMTQTF